VNDAIHRTLGDIRQAGNLDWDYLLSTGGELQEAVSQDILSQLRALRREDSVS
jgi:hypothetical protein